MVISILWLLLVEISYFCCVIIVAEDVEHVAQLYKHQAICSLN